MKMERYLWSYPRKLCSDWTHVDGGFELKNHIYKQSLIPLTQ